MKKNAQLDAALDTDAALAHTGECEDCSRAISRRTLFGGLLIGGVAMMTSGGLSVQAAFAEGNYTGDTIVVLSLRGGMDGLSVVAPLGDPAYAKARPTTALKESSAIKVDSMFALHPSLAPVKSLWDAGQFAAVHAVGSMDQSRSHFSAMEQIENAAPGTSLRTGWLDRVMGMRKTSDTFAATQVGGSTTPRMAMGPNPEMMIPSLAGTKLNVASSATDLATWQTLSTAMHANTSSPLATPVHAALQASMAALGMKTTTPSVSYPKTSLGGALSDIAAMIKTGAGLQIATVDQGDWDHHENAASRMTTSVGNVADCLAAFAADLGPLWNKVTVVTLSEFGRRVKENGSAGFDHGHGNVMLLAGGSSLTGSKVFGTWPTLEKSKLRGGEDLAGTTDYRSVFTELLTKRAGMSSSQARDAFPNFDAQSVGAFKNA